MSYKKVYIGKHKTVACNEYGPVLYQFDCSRNCCKCAAASIDTNVLH